MKIETLVQVVLFSNPQIRVAKQRVTRRYLVLLDGPGQGIANHFL